MKQLDQRGFTAFEIVIVLFLFGFLFIALYFAYINSPYSPRNKVTSPPSTRSSTAGVCDFHNNTVGCGINSFKVLAPVSGTQICEGSIFDVKWAAPADMETTTLTVRQDALDGTQYSLGTYPAGQGQYEWNVTGIPPGEVYQMWINSAYKSVSVNNVSAGLFTIKDCASPTSSPTASQ